MWGSVQALKELEDYTTLPDDLVGSSKRWREWMELERPGELHFTRSDVSKPLQRDGFRAWS